jgi:hypothetical protein
MGISAHVINTASENYVETAKIQKLGRFCDLGNRYACKALAKETDGQCASPNASHGCRFDSLATIKND